MLVKSWLLALPHLIIIGALTGASTVRWSDPRNPGIRYETATGVSLFGFLVLVAAVILLFSGRYQRPLFNLLTGFNRWIYRVITYVALMRDGYPPFRLDQGPLDVSERGPVPLESPVPPSGATPSGAGRQWWPRVSGGWLSAARRPAAATSAPGK